MLIKKNSKYLDGYKLLKEINKMAEQKIDPDRPKDDQAPSGTTFVPKATPPVVNEKGEVAPLGPETLEKQRAGFKKVEEAATKQDQENPLDVKGVEADVENAKQNPAESGPVGYTKEDVEKKGEETKKAVDEQEKKVKTKGKK